MRLISTLLLSFIIGATTTKLQPTVFHVFRESGEKENYPFACIYAKAYKYKGIAYFVNDEKVFDDGKNLVEEKWKDLGVFDIINVKKDGVSEPILYISKDITKDFAKSMKFRCTIGSSDLSFGFNFVEKETCTANATEGKEGDIISFTHSVELSTMDTDMTDGTWIAEWEKKEVTKNVIKVNNDKQLQKYNQQVQVTLQPEMNGKDLTMTYKFRGGIDSKLSLFTECVKKLNVQYISEKVTIVPKQDEYRIPQTVRCTAESNPKPTIHWVSDKTGEKVGEGQELTFERDLFEDEMPEKPGDKKKVMRNFTCKVESGSNKVQKKVSFKIVVENIKEEKTEAGNSQTAAIAAGVVICLIILVIVGAVVVYYCRKKAQTGAKKVPTEDDDMKHKFSSDRNNANA